MQVLISYVCQVVNSFFVAIFCDRCLCCTFKKFPSILIFTLFSAVTFGLKFLSFGSQPALITAIVLYEVGFYTFILVSFKAPLFQRLLFGVLLYMVCLSIECIMVITFQVMGIDTQYLNPHTMVYFIFSIIGFVGNLVAGFYIVSLWKKVFLRGGTKYLLYFSMLPLVIIFLCQFMLFPFLAGRRESFTPAFTVVAVFMPLLCMILFLVFLHRLEKRDIHDAYVELQAVYEMERERYETIKFRQDELAKLRHDYNNQLSAVRSLVDSHKYLEACELANLIKKAWEEAGS